MTTAFSGRQSWTLSWAKIPGQNKNISALGTVPRKCTDWSFGTRNNSFRCLRGKFFSTWKPYYGISGCHHFYRQVPSSGPIARIAPNSMAYLKHCLDPNDTSRHQWNTGWSLHNRKHPLRFLKAVIMRNLETDRFFSLVAHEGPQIALNWRSCLVLCRGRYWPRI